MWASVKKIGLWGTYFEQVWIEGPEDYFITIGRTNDKAWAYFGREDVPPGLREWMFKRIIEAGDRLELERGRQGNRLYCELKDIAQLHQAALDANRYPSVKYSDGAKAYFEELEKAAEAQRQEQARQRHEAFKAIMRREAERDEKRISGN
jgi:hypothetical protein